MKAAVLYAFGQVPRYADFPDPTPGPDEVLVDVKAVALENVDKAMARGSHFATRQFLTELPAIVGFDGIGMLDGQLIGFGGMKPPYGAMAEKVVIPKGAYAPIPEGVDAVTAATVPASALTALFPLKWSARLEPGQTVLINGATGVSGKLGVQIAKMLGAGRIVGTGRDVVSLDSLQELGADAVIDLKQSDEQIVEAFKKEGGTGYDVILDFLWGHPTELLVQAIVPHELAFPPKRTRLLQIGEMAGSTIALPADALRTSGLEISGAGSSLTPQTIAEGMTLVWDWIQQGKFKIDIEPVPLRDVEQAWQRTDLHGKRLVIVP